MKQKVAEAVIMPFDEVIETVDTMVIDMGYSASKNIKDPKAKRQAQYRFKFFASVQHYLQQLQTINSKL